MLFKPPRKASVRTTGIAMCSLQYLFRFSLKIRTLRIVRKYFFFHTKTINKSLFLLIFCRRRGGLMVSALNSGSGGPGSSPGQGTALCSWARHFTLIVPLSTQVYKWVPTNLLLGVTLRSTSIPSRGE